MNRAHGTDLVGEVGDARAKHTGETLRLRLIAAEWPTDAESFISRVAS